MVTAVVPKPSSAVEHPDHYQTESGMEAWDVIEAFTDDLSGVEAFDTGNVIKYICRWKKKNGIEDLKKAKEYIEHLIKYEEKMERRRNRANAKKKKEKEND